MNPPLRAEDDRAALVEALRDGTIACVATDHAPHARHEKEVPFEAAPFGVTGLETAFAALYTHLVEPGLLPLETLLERMSAGPGARATASTRRGSRSARRRTSSCSTRGELAGQRGRLPLALGELVAARRDAARPGACDGRRRPAGARGMNAASSLLEDGTVFRGESVGAAGLRVRRGRLHDRDDRLPGGRHRPELRGADRLLHGADGRQLRRRGRRAPSRRAAHARAVVMREARGPAWTDWLARARASSRSTGIDTRSLVLHLRDAGAMRASRSRARPRVDEALRGRARAAAMAGRALVGAGLDAGAVRPRRRGRGRVAVVDYGGKRSILRRLAAAGAAVTVFPHDVDADALAGYDGVLLSNGPGDPEPLADEVARSGDCSAACRCSASASATSCSRSRPGTRRSSCRSATAARTTRCSSARPAACSSRARTTASRSSRRDDAGGDARLALRRHRRGPRLPRACAPARCSSTPRPGPGPHDAWPIIDELGRGGAPCRGGTTSTRSA